MSFTARVMSNAGMQQMNGGSRVQMNASHSGAQTARVTSTLTSGRQQDRSSASLHSQQESKENGNGHADYSSNGASVEETRPERYTSDFVRCLTPRSLHACAENGVLPKELIYRTEASFEGQTSAASTAGVIASLHAGQTPAIVQHLRWKDYETSRLLALEKVRTTRRRHISGLRHSLFGISGKEKAAREKEMQQQQQHASTLPAVGLSQASLHHSHHSRSQSSHSHHHPHTSRPVSTTHSRPSPPPASHTYPNPSSLYPAGHVIKEHPFFLSHPQHDRVHGLQNSGGASMGNVQQASLIPQALEWNAMSPEGRGHLCLRMREHLLREKEREEWEKSEERREARARRRREQRENEWYQERKIALRRAKKQGQQTAPPTEPVVPRVTRAEMLRAAGANSMFLQQQQQQAGGLPNGLSDSSGLKGDRRMSLQPASSTLPTLGSKDSVLPGVKELPGMRERSESKENGGHGQQQTQQNSSNPTTAIKSTLDIPTNVSFAERVQTSVNVIAEKYASFFEREKQKIVARQESEIARLAQAERYRFEMQKKQDELAKKRLERRKQEKTRRELIAQEHQKLREAKYARVESEEYERVARIEAALEERLERTKRKRAEYEAQIREGIRERQTLKEQQDEERKWKVILAYENRHRILVENLKHLHERYEHAKEKLREQKEKEHKERVAKGATIEQKLQTALERQHEQCEKKYREHLVRTEKHAARDVSAMVKKAQEVSEARAAKAREKEEHKQFVLAVKEQEYAARVEAILSKDERDAQRLKEQERARAEALVLQIEKKRLEEARKQRNLEREERRVAFHHAQLSEKLEKDFARLQTIHAMKQEYAAKREEFMKRSFTATREFKETYTKLRTHGALAAIVKEAKARQKEIDRVREEEQYA